MACTVHAKVCSRYGKSGRSFVFSEFYNPQTNKPFSFKAVTEGKYLYKIDGKWIISPEIWIDVINVCSDQVTTLNMTHDVRLSFEGMSVYGRFRIKMEDQIVNLSN